MPVLADDVNVLDIVFPVPPASNSYAKTDPGSVVALPYVVIDAGAVIVPDALITAAVINNPSGGTKRGAVDLPLEPPCAATVT